jgi:hypothetical protein
MSHIDALSDAAITAIRRASVLGQNRQPERDAVRKARALWRAAEGLQEAEVLRARLQSPQPFFRVHSAPARPRRPFDVGTWQGD